MNNPKVSFCHSFYFFQLHTFNCISGALFGQYKKPFHKDLSAFHCTAARPFLYFLQTTFAVALRIFARRFAKTRKPVRTCAVAILATRCLMTGKPAPKLRPRMKTKSHRQRFWIVPSKYPTSYQEKFYCLIMSKFSASLTQLSTWL